MSTKALILGIVGTGCVVAAGAGGYLAVRTASGESAQGAAVAAPAPQSAGGQSQTASAPAIDRSPSTSPNQAPAKSTSSPATTKTSAASEAKNTADEKAPPAATPSTDAVPPTTPATVAASEPPPVTDPATATPPVTETASAPPDAAKARFEELTVKEESVIGIRLDSAVSSDTAKVEDKVTARVTRDVTVNGRTAIPSGTRLEGYVSAVNRGGKFKDAAKLSIRFTSIVMNDNTRVSIQTEALTREGDSPGNEATAKVGAGTVLGAVIGGLIGGKKGAAVGAGAGAAGGSAAVAAGGRNTVTLPAGAALTVKLTSPVTLTIEREDRS